MPSGFRYQNSIGNAREVVELVKEICPSEWAKDEVQWCI